MNLRGWQKMQILQMNKETERKQIICHYYENPESPDVLINTVANSHL